MKKQSDTYKEVRIMQHRFGVARVYIPDLAPEERERRMREIEKAAIEIVVKGKIKNENIQEVKKSPLVG